MNGWKEIFLSHAGKEILLEVVIQAIHSYTMSFFQLSKSLCRGINDGKTLVGSIRKHKQNCMDELDSDGQTQRKWRFGSIHPGSNGKAGMAATIPYRDLGRKVFCEKYPPGSCFLESNLRRRPSFAWRSIWNAKKLLSEGLI